VEWALQQSPQHTCLIEQSALGWKEYELEVMRDVADNVVIICSIENFDAMGVHTGDSITVAPAQTLTDREYQEMRNAAVAIIREIGVETGGSNIQFAVNPVDGALIVIEMNPRVSRSSALASKATGFPIAKIAAKLAVGYTLDELRNDITRETPASFEPSIDYVVTKVPRFTFEKFSGVDDVLTTQMKSVGEAMAIGRTFKESLQKAVRSLETGHMGFDTPEAAVGQEGLESLWPQVDTPRPERLWAVVEALRRGASVDEIHERSWLDPWFLRNLSDIVQMEEGIAAATGRDEQVAWLRAAKQAGFSDSRLGELWSTGEDEVRALRHAEGVRPVYKRVDTCAAEFEAHTPYLYSTYEDECEADVTARRKVIILGGGPNRIGQGIEFDYCCVHASYALAEAGFETIMVNCNPETVSTDYDTSDRLYFEPLTLEDVLAIVDVEKPEGVIVQFGGQTPLKLAMALEKAGVPILGTPPDAIDRAEDRERFEAVLEKLKLERPPAGLARSAEEAEMVASRIGYPVLVRPSYVLGGRAMEIVHDVESLRTYMRTAVKASPDHPILVDRFLADATEVDVDAISDGRTGGCALGRLGLLDPALFPHGRGDRGHPRRNPATGAGARCQGPDERAVRREGRADLSHRGQPARLAYGALRVQGHRPPPGEARGAGDVGQDPRGTRLYRGDLAATLFRQGSRVPLREVSRCRHAARARDEEHRRGHGNRLRLRTLLRQGADPGRQQPARRGAGAGVGEEGRPRQDL
jgi:carbamoyl-phosphate synthase large subunit